MFVPKWTAENGTFLTMCLSMRCLSFLHELTNGLTPSFVNCQCSNPFYRLAQWGEEWREAVTSPYSVQSRLPHPKGRGDSVGISPPYTGNTQAYLSSLSSRLTSFFCFRVSSRLRRASASSLTARSRSRLRLSHRVLVEKGKVKVTVNEKKAGRDCGLYHTTCQPLFLRVSLIKRSAWHQSDQATM